MLGKIICRPNFYNIRITQEDVQGCTSVAGGMDLYPKDAPAATVRNYAAERGIEVELAVEEEMLHKAEEFREQGSEIYKEV
jgi:hypothetical protein